MKYKDPITGEYKELFLKASDTLPIGAIVPYGSDDIPTNWLLCDGSEVSRTTYANLFSVIGTNFGEGDGETTFNLPDNTVQPSLVTNYIIKSGMSVGVMGSVVNEKTDSSKDTYSCDYIEKIVNESMLETYTEGEVKIGTFLGKPLYRKVGKITFDSVYNGSGSYKRGSLISRAIENLTITKIFNSISGCADVYNGYNSAVTSNIYVENSSDNMDKGYVMGFTNKANFLNIPFYVVVEYTKTTDNVEE